MQIQAHKQGLAERRQAQLGAGLVVGERPAITLVTTTNNEQRTEKPMNEGKPSVHQTSNSHTNGRAQRSMDEAILSLEERIAELSNRLEPPTRWQRIRGVLIPSLVSSGVAAAVAWGVARAAVKQVIPIS